MTIIVKAKHMSPIPLWSCPGLCSVLSTGPWHRGQNLQNLSRRADFLFSGLIIPKSDMTSAIKSQISLKLTLFESTWEKHALWFLITKNTCRERTTHAFCLWNFPLSFYPSPCYFSLITLNFLCCIVLRCPLFANKILLWPFLFASVFKLSLIPS